MKQIMILFASLGLAACSHSTQIATDLPRVDQSQLLGVKMAPMPGKFAIYVQSGTWDRKVNVSGWTCAAHSFDLGADEDFYNYFTSTLSRVVENGVIAPAPLSPEQLSDGGYTAQLAIHSTVLEPNLTFSQNLFSASAVMTLKAGVHLVIRTPNEIIGQSTIETSQSAQSGAGLACEGASDAIGQAAGAALQDLVSRTVERVYSIYGLASSHNRKDTAIEPVRADQHSLAR